MPKMYTLLNDDGLYLSRRKGTLAGYRPMKIFGRLDCKSGMRMNKDNRVFFATLEDAVNAGYRPCMNCKPIDEDDFEGIKHLVPEKTLEAFYRRGKRK